MTIQTIVFESAWLTPSGLVSYQLDGSEEDGCADADDLDPSRHRPGCFRERLLRRSDPLVEALHVNRLAHSCNTRLRTASGASRSEERRVGKSVDLGGRRIIKKKKKT